MSQATLPPAGDLNQEGGIIKQLMVFAPRALAVYAGTQLLQKFVFDKFPIPPKPEHIHERNNKLRAEKGLPPAPPPPGVNVPVYDPLDPVQVKPSWEAGQKMDVWLQFSTEPAPAFGQIGDLEMVSTKWEGIVYGDWSINKTWSGVLPLSESVKYNGSLYLDMFLTKTEVSPDPSSPSYEESEVSITRKELTRWYPKKKIRKEKLLIKSTTSEEEDEDEEEEEEVYEDPVEAKKLVSYWHPNVSIALIQTIGDVSYKGLPLEGKAYVNIDKSAPPTYDNKGHYYPVLFPNDFWLFKSGMTPIVPTNTSLPFSINLSTDSFWKFNVYSAVQTSFEAQSKQAGGSGGEMDEIKRVLVETNPILLITTILVSILHMLFEFLAFSSDISHWRKKDELVGVSLRTIITNCVVQLIILLYLQDNNQETSWMILLGQGMGLLIEAWKVTKILNFNFVPAEPGSLIPYKLDITDKKVLSEEEKQSQEYDALAFRLVSYGATPLLVGYTIYSLIYETHRGWYSFIVTTLAQAIYMFGFVQLIPQLIINYKLKSVAHIPMKAMVYKTLSTVVDDFFSFVIKMPWLHRLACFRDDVVFLILLYQMWIYKVDKSRANEYGQVSVELPADPSETEKEKKESKKTK